MFKRILAAVDLGPSTDELLAQALRLSPDAEVAVCHVAPADKKPFVLRPSSSAWDADAVETQAQLRARLELHVARALKSSGRSIAAPPFETVVDVGLAEEQIVRRAVAFLADLVVVSTAGRRGVERALLGSVAEQVVRTAPCPVLVVRPGGGDGPVLAATDLTDGSFPAIELGAALAREQGRDLVVVHALGRGALTPEGLTRRSGTDADRFVSARGWIYHALGKLAARADTAILDGKPETEIPAESERRRAALIVVGTHGRTGLARMFVGSVAEAIIRHAPCSVLVVRLGS